MILFLESIPNNIEVCHHRAAAFVMDLYREPWRLRLHHRRIPTLKSMSVVANPMMNFARNRCDNFHN